jgi:hypothetical protein
MAVGFKIEKYVDPLTKEDRYAAHRRDGDNWAGMTVSATMEEAKKQIQDEVKVQSSKEEFFFDKAGNEMNEVIDGISIREI